MEQTVKFNKKWAKEHKKAEFIEVHKAAYPELDLGAVYDKLVGKEKPEATAQ